MYRNFGGELQTVLCMLYRSSDKGVGCGRKEEQSCTRHTDSVQLMRKGMAVKAE